MITLCTCRGHHSDQHVCHAYAGLCSCRALASLANLVAGCACAQAFSYRDSLSGTSMTARVAGFCFLLTGLSADQGGIVTEEEARRNEEGLRENDEVIMRKW